MMIYAHKTAPTQFVEANGIRFAYRRFGKAGGVPLVFNMHYIGTMDYWDPAVTDGLARDREVILFNNAGVSSSSGEVPTTFEQMGANAVAFSRALGLNKADVLGFSIGGMVAQEIALQAPDLVRKLILVGTGPRGGHAMESLTQVAKRIFGAVYDPPEHMWLAVLFSPSEAAQAAGKEFLKRKHLRQEGRDAEVNDKVSPAQIEAMDKDRFGSRVPLRKRWHPLRRRPERRRLPKVLGVPQIQKARNGIWPIARNGARRPAAPDRQDWAFRADVGRTNKQNHPSLASLPRRADSRVDRHPPANRV
jgi:pimeloyl-ACP methyl ester carboxylesterase